MKEKVKVPLTSFIRSKCIYLTIKWTANEIKTLYFGANKEYNFKTLTFIVNPKYDKFLFRFESNGSKGKFIQDEKGDFEININRDISIDGYTENINMSYPYIKSSFSRYINGKQTRYERYIQIKTI